MKKIVIILAAAMLFMAGCKKKQEKESIIGRPSVTVQDGRFTPELMWKLGKMGEYALSPDGSTIAYTNTFYDMAQNKGNAEIYLISTDGKTEAMRLTNTSQSEFNPVWLNSSTLLFARGNDSPTARRFSISPTSPYVVPTTSTNSTQASTKPQVVSTRTLCIATGMVG